MRPPDFEVFYRENLTAARRLAVLVTGSTEDGEDVAQEAFLQLTHRWIEVRNKRAYLYQSVVNLSRTKVRRLQTERNYRDRLRPSIQDLPAEDRSIWTALDRLPQNQREALVLRYYLDLKLKDVAAALGIPTGTAKSLLHRGLQTLRMERDDEERV